MSDSLVSFYTISKISQYLTKEQKQTIIHAYVTPRLDQNNSLLGGLPSTQMNKLQLVQNSAAKIILGGKIYNHVTDHLIKLHWLPISQRRTFKILLLVFKALNGQGPIYLAEMLVPCSNSEHDLRSSYDNNNNNNNRFLFSAFSHSSMRFIQLHITICFFEKFCLNG